MESLNENENDYSGIANTILKENKFILEYLTKKYEITLQLSDGEDVNPVIILSASKVDDFIYYMYEKKIKYEEFQHMGDLLNPFFYKTIDSIYDFFLDAFKKKIIFIKEIKDRIFFTLSVEYEILGKKTLSVNIQLLEKKRNTEDLIEKLFQKVNILEEENKNMKEELIQKHDKENNFEKYEELKNRYDTLKEEHDKLLKEHEHLKTDFMKYKEDNTKKINELIKRNKNEKSELIFNNNINTKSIIIPKIYDKIYYGGRRISDTRTISKFGKNYCSLSSIFKFVCFLIGFDNDNYYLFSFYIREMDSKGQFSIKFPIEFQFYYNYKNYDSFCDFGGFLIGSDNDKMIINKYRLLQNKETIITMSDLTILPKNAYYIVLPK